MEKVNNLVVNKKQVYRLLKKETKTSYKMCRLNSLVFKIGKFIQNVYYCDESKINKMYYDFNRVNLINKSFLAFIKGNLLTCNNYDSLVIIAEMLSIYKTSNNEIMGIYNNSFNKLMTSGQYSSTEVSATVSKILKKNKYIENV